MTINLLIKWQSAIEFKSCFSNELVCITPTKKQFRKEFMV